MCTRLHSYHSILQPLAQPQDTSVLVPKTWLERPSGHISDSKAAPGISTRSGPAGLQVSVLSPREMGLAQVQDVRQKESLFSLFTWVTKRMRWLDGVTNAMDMNLGKLQDMEKAMAPHSSTLAWEISWMEEPGRLQSMGLEESDTTEWLHFHFSLSCTGEGNGNPLQCSCLENPRDGGAWWAALYGVAQSQIRLKRLSSSSSLILIRQFHTFIILLYSPFTIRIPSWNPSTSEMIFA